MRKYLLLAALAVLAALWPMAPRAAVALSCAHPKDQLKDYALLVEARVVTVAPGFRGLRDGSRPEYVTLAVKRYFKGEGPPRFEAVYDGAGWEQMKPAGSDVIMGFFLDEAGGLKAGPCTLLMNAAPANAFEQEMLTIIRTAYGEGKAPDPGAAPIGDEPGRNQRRWLLWGGLGAAVAVAAAVGFAYSRRHRD